MLKQWIKVPTFPCQVSSWFFNQYQVNFYKNLKCLTSRFRPAHTHTQFIVASKAHGFVPNLQVLQLPLKISVVDQAIVLNWLRKFYISSLSCRVSAWSSLEFIECAAALSVTVVFWLTYSSWQVHNLPCTMQVKWEIFSFDI